MLFNSQNSFVCWSFENLILIVSVWFPNPKFDTSGNTIIIRHELINYCHWPFISFTVSFQQTASPTWKFRCLSFHFCLNCSWHKNSFFHLAQNSIALCFVLHLHLLKMSGGKISFELSNNVSRCQWCWIIHITDCVSR